MGKTEKGKAFKTSLWVNPIIIAVFAVANIIGRYELGWQRDTSFIIAFSLFLAVSALVNYYLFLVWDKPEKTKKT
jgi:hypothetical protein